MAPFQQRVVDEKSDLDGKIERLSEFVKGETFAKLDVAERGRLLNQIGIMLDYSGILGDRIAMFADA